MDKRLIRSCTPCDNHQLIESTKLLAPDAIIMEVCDFLVVPVGRIIGNRRSANLVYARHIICDILYSDAFLNLSLKQIGRLLGGRDHTTVINAIRSVRNQCEINPFYRDRYRRLHLFLYNSDRYFKYSENYFRLNKENKVPKSREFMQN